MAEETKFNIKIGVVAVLSFFCALIVFFAGAIYNHQGRITTLETHKVYTAEWMVEMKSIMTAVRNDQVRREQTEILNQERLEAHIKGDAFRKEHKR